MLGDPRSGSKVGESLDRQIGKSVEDSGLTSELFSKENSTTACTHFDIRHSVMHTSVPLVRKPGSSGVPTASEALGRRWRGLVSVSSNAC